MKILSISHTDLDGYGAQYAINKHFKQDDVHNVNLNYSEVQYYIEDLDFKQYDEIYITDLNLTYDLSRFIDTNKGKTKVTLIDHHECDERNLLFNWYNVDKSVSGALYTSKFVPCSDDVKAFVELVSVYDMWQKNHPDFYKATFVSDIVFNVPLAYPSSKREFIFNFFDNFINLEQNISIQELEKWYIDFVFRLETSNKSLPSRINIIMSEFEYFMHDVEAYMLYSPVIQCNVSIVNLPASNFQTLSSAYLGHNPDVVLVNFNPERGTGSTRSTNKKAIDVAKLLGGGGHADAGGFGGKKDFTMSELDDILMKGTK
jgi:oligoribonuclease NrnB/cAMP/cGMP phosphodiesterase (DHH superfamily)